MAASTSAAPRAICPWPFLNLPSATEKPSPPLAQAATPKTFASVLSGSVESTVALSQLPTPVIRGDMTYVKINEALYQEQLKTFKTNLIGRLLQRKGSAPLKLHDLKTSLTALWDTSSPWRLVPLGRGYFDIHFATEEDMRRVWGGLPNFKPGDTLPQTHSQKWVRFYGLSQDYWHPQHLIEIARGVGTPLQLDRATKEREFGYFARVLVDVDLAGDFPSTLMVERESHGFPIEVIYENMFENCGIVGHTMDRCEHLIKEQAKASAYSKGVFGSERPMPKVRQEYRVKAKHQVPLCSPDIAEQPIIDDHSKKDAEIAKFADNVIQ
ncbi:uncharacterized protein LOC112194381 [Rosa chinensis]|uniref:uncharacterized protein LOC112194381 n=1 Tax=Rosa chinensis TaxID=74649 RepID=UPI000D095916|nr:uncharacterized protein LOC112194381 [Rosa chinensis]